MPRTREQEDARRDAIALVVATFLIVSTFFGISAFYLWSVGAFLTPGQVQTSWQRLGSNLTASIAMSALLALMPAARSWRLSNALVAIVPAAAVAGAVRLGMLVLTGVTAPETRPLAVEGASGFVYCVSAACLAYGYTSVRRRERIEARHAATSEYQRELALRTLETEEVRVRRAIAEGLHGSLQQRLVVASVQVDMLLERLRAREDAAEEVASLESLRHDLEQIRENDVRETSRLLYPDGIEIGVVPAVRMLLRRLPAGIATRLRVGDALRTLDDPGSSGVRPSDRLLVVRVVEEAVTNGLRHGHATSFVVELRLVDDVIVLDVANNGVPVGTGGPGEGTGTRRLRERVELAGGTFSLVTREPGASDDPEVAAHPTRVLARIPLGRGNVGDDGPGVPAP